MIDTAGTLCKAAAELRNMGAKKVYAIATHGVFSNPAPTNIKESILEKVLISNTIPLRQEFIDIVPKDKYDQISIGTLVAETIRRIYHRESVSGMFEKDNYRH